MAVKAIIQNSKNEVLLLKVNTELRDSNKWDLPGSLMEFDDSVETRLNKEVLEETGLTLQNWRLLEVSETIFERFTFGDEVKDVKIIVIGFTTNVMEENLKIILSDEHDNYKWFSWESLREIELSKPTRAIVGKNLHA